MHTQDKRPLFASLVHEQMKRNKNIWVITGDLGYVMWDEVQRDFPDRFLNTGAAEQAMMGVAVGLALQGKIPVVYSITPFLLYRPFETIRNYIDHEKIPVKLIGSGNKMDYANEGFSHWSLEDRAVMRIFKNIHAHWPKTNEELIDVTAEMWKNSEPYYINLRRKPR